MVYYYLLFLFFTYVKDCVGKCLVVCFGFVAGCLIVGWFCLLLLWSLGGVCLWFCVWCFVFVCVSFFFFLFSIYYFHTPQYQSFSYQNHIFIPSPLPAPQEVFSRKNYCFLNRTCSTKPTHNLVKALIKIKVVKAVLQMFSRNKHLHRHYIDS